MKGNWGCFQILEKSSLCPLECVAMIPKNLVFDSDLEKPKDKGLRGGVRIGRLSICFAFQWPEQTSSWA